MHHPLIVSKATEQRFTSCILSIKTSETGGKKYTYRPAADRQNCDGSRTGGPAEVIQRTREESWINKKVKSFSFLKHINQKMLQIYRKFIFSDGESRSKLKLSCSWVRERWSPLCLFHSFQLKKALALLNLLPLCSLSGCGSDKDSFSVSDSRGPSWSWNPTLAVSLWTTAF